MSKRGWSSETSSSDEVVDQKRQRQHAEDGTESGSSSHDSSTGDEQRAASYLSQKGQYSNVASRMMAKMGYKAGKGLGAKQQGRVEPVEASKQRGRRGLGLTIKTLEKEVVVEWEDEKPPSAQETVEWMKKCDKTLPDYDDLCEWRVEGKRKLTIEDEDVFCDQEVLTTMLTCKTIFDELEGPELRLARTRCNPYEAIRGAIFLNRAAMKMANLDHVFDYAFTSPKDLAPNETLYFADVCAGPGGFSEYVLWRKKWHAKGFGFTLKGKNDFKLGDFFAADPEFFETHYGVKGVNGDGDIMNTDNLEEFQNFVLSNTDGKGVHFLTADGGFSVEGQENIQEILTKQLLLCQFACALSVVRVGGTFLCKTFDLFTVFSVGLVYLLWRAFEEVSLFKPVTSRPANSERYVVCKGYRDSNRLIGDYLFSINQTLNEMKDTDNDVTAVVPLDVMMEDPEFCDYVKKSNEMIANDQCKALAKMHAFAKDSELKELSQATIRTDCLKLWKVPDKVRAAPPKTNSQECFSKHIDGMKNPLDSIKNPKALDSDSLHALERIYDYRCFVSSGRRALLVSLGGPRLYEWNYMSRRWTSVNDINCLIPRNSILEVEIVQELSGEGKGQRRNTAVHVLDAIVLCGEDISSRHYTERMSEIQLFVTAIQKPSLPHLTTIRAKQIYRTESIEEVFKCLSMRVVKGGGIVPRLCCDTADSESFYVPTGLCFVKLSKEPWTMAFSKSQKRKYFFNTATRSSSFECPPDFSAPYDVCVSSRMYWSWEEGVKIHDEQVHRREGSLSKDDVLKFLSQHR